MNADPKAPLLASRPHAVAKKRRPGAGRPTRSQAKQREVELLERALDLFLERGFERTTIDAITASAGMAKRTVYLRYPDKTALFKAAMLRAIEEWIVPVERLRAAETEDLHESLLRIGQILVDNILSPAGLRLMRITNAESGRLPEIGVYAYRQGTDRTIAYLADLFRRRARLGDLEIFDPEIAAQGFLYLIVGGRASVSAWGLTLEKAEIDKHTRENVQLFLHGLLPRQNNAGMLTVELPQDVRRTIEALEDENRRLKMLLAESMLDLAALKARN